MMNSEKTTQRDRNRSLISAVLPVYNEVAILRELTHRLTEVLSNQSRQFEIVYVNDGSSDGCREVLDELALADRRIVVVHLARNFGHQPAVHAGLENCTGDAVIVMDSDLQDDPQAIPRFLEQWEQGYDVVYAERFNRKESFPKRMLFYGFYRVLNAVSSTVMPEDAGNFGLMDRRVVDIVCQLPEKDRYFPGLRCWTGFRQTGIPVERAARHDEHPRVSMRGLVRLAKTAIFSFSTFPLTFFFIIAALSAATCVTSVGFVLFHKLFTGLAVPGWASVISTASFFGALNALGISILGEYVIRIYDQVRGRPIYVAESIRNLPGLAQTGLVRSGQQPRSQTADSASSGTERVIDRVELLLEELQNSQNPLKSGLSGTRQTFPSPVE